MGRADIREQTCARTWEQSEIKIWIRTKPAALVHSGVLNQKRAITGGSALQHVIVQSKCVVVCELRQILAQTSATFFKELPLLAKPSFYLLCVGTIYNNHTIIFQGFVPWFSERQYKTRGGNGANVLKCDFFDRNHV